MKSRWICNSLVIVGLMIFVGCSKYSALTPDKILSVSDPDGEYVSIMMGTDDSHLVNIIIDRNQIRQGLQTNMPKDIMAFNGKDNMYEHSPKKHGTEVSFTINTLTPKNKTAMVTVSAKLVSSKPGQGDYLKVPETTLYVTGRQFDNLVAAYKK